jgi:serine/threonine protein kinase/TolB-like protein/Tfp pilus assembly protein PilF
VSGVSPAAPRLGDTVGHYELLSVLGRGGMGVVYLAEDRLLHRRVALKMLPPETAADPERLKRFRREAKTVASLSHPNVVTLYTVEEADGQTFLTMELVEGRTLSEEIPMGGLPLRRALEIASALAGALAAAHARGILHRDLKPSNVMVGPGGWVKVLDFGLAKLRPPDDATLVEGRGTSLLLTQEGKILGTPSYMSPEQLRGHPVDEKSDLFSFGLMLHEMLAGTLPFAGQNSAERIAAVMRDPPTPVAVARPDVPPGLVRLIEACLEKQPEARPTTAEVRDRLAALQRELEISDLMQTSGLTKSRPLVALPRRRGQIAGAALALAALVGIGLWKMPRSPRQPGAAAAAQGAAEAVRPSLAVLPLGNFSGEPDYFVDGMTDALIGSLARVGGLRVISRQSSMHYKGSKLRLHEIAAELGVDYVVEGSVARRGDRLSLQAQVIRPDPEEQLWAESFDRAAADVLALHNEVARRIAGALHAPLSRQEEFRMASASRVEPAAYEAFLQGRYWSGKFGADDLLKASGYFERAVALDPGFGEAWTGLADARVRLGLFHGDTATRIAQAEAAAQRALQINESLGSAHATLSSVSLSRWEWSAAEEEARRAVELDPNSSLARRNYWHLLAALGRVDEARDQIELAMQLDPLSAHIASNLGMQLLLEKRYDDAEQELARALELDPDFSIAHGWLWLIYAKTEKEPARSRELAAYVGAMGFQALVPELEQRLARDGYGAGLAWIARRVSSDAEGDPNQVGFVGGLLAEAGEAEEAMRWLRFGLEQRVWEMPWLAVSPDYDRIRDRPDFREVVGRLGIPPGAA